MTYQRIPGAPASGTTVAVPRVNAIPGEYWSYPTVHGTVVTTAGSMLLTPAYFPLARTISRIGGEVTAGAVGSTLSLGIYASDSNGRPTGDPVLDAGTIDGNSATAQELTVSFAAAMDTLYWLAALPAGGTPTIRSLATTGVSFSGAQTSLANALGTGVSRQGLVQASVVGTALPTIGTLAISGSPALVAIKV